MADGDEAALALLYDQWSQRVHNLAFWILKDGDEAEDVVEETFWQAWRTASRYDERRGGASTWLLMIARSRALDRLRARRRLVDWTASPATTSAFLDLAGAAKPEAPDDRSETAERQLTVAAALGALPLEQRQALELAFFGGLSHSEIAAHMAEPLGTVKTRIRLAMQKLRQLLKPLREDDR